VSAKKAKGKGKSRSKSSGEEDKSETAESVDMGQVRENVNNLVWGSADRRAAKVIEVALTGQLASAKYLFEMAGLYPATAEIVATPEEHSLAHTLLTRMGIPLEPVVRGEGSVPAAASASIQSDPSSERGPRI
jgi:hypothetical protein